METQFNTSDAGGSIDLLENDAIQNDTPANNGDDRGDSNEPNNNQSQTGDTKQADSAPISKVDDKQKDNQNPDQKPKFQSRGERREQEIKTMLAEVKREREEFRRERETWSRNSPQNPNQNQPQEPVFVEQPKKPTWTREQLTAEYAKAKAAGDEVTMQAAQNAFAEWDKYETDLKFWRMENGQKVERFNTARRQNWNKALERFPDLKNADSALYREAKSLAQQFPEVLQRMSGDGEYLIAQLAGMRMERRNHTSEVGALKEQVKKLTEQLNSTQKRIQPASQGAAPVVAKPGEGKTPLERLEAKLAA